MKTSWSQSWNRRDHPDVSPYHDWANGLVGPQEPVADVGSPSALVQACALDFDAFVDFALIHGRGGPATVGEAAIGGDSPAALSEALEHSPYIPSFAANADFDQAKPWLPDDEALEALDMPDDGVIVGVIDRGIALGQHRSRLTGGGTRILSAWQQIADRSVEHAAQVGNANLPNGLEFLGSDINALIERHTLDSGYFDEDAFNRAVGAGDYRNLRGHRELGRRDSHGTHVLDLAAGAPPIGADPLRDKTRLAVVNLPDRALVGAESRHLEYFVLSGLFRMIEFSDALWAAKHPSHGEGPPKGYPMVVNLSFAKQSGPKDGGDLVSRFMAQVNTAREARGQQPVLLVTPAGNNNLERGNVKRMLQPCEPNQPPEPSQMLEMDWRIVPGDQSANFVEIWTGADTVEGEGPSTVQNPGLSVVVTTPDGASSPAEIGQPGEFADNQGVARIYCEGRLKDGANTLTTRLRYLICTAPAASPDATRPVAPAGRWRIRIVNHSKRPMKVQLSIQVDQSLRLDGVTGRRSYFDEEAYQERDPAGRVLDTFASPWADEPLTWPPFHDYDERIAGTSGALTNALIKRKGTLNELSRNAFVILKDGSLTLVPRAECEGVVPGALIAAGHRRSDGRPASYSSTGEFQSAKADHHHITAPTVSFPVDESPTSLGVLAAGARDGSVVALSGTSFASAQLTRWVAQFWLGNPSANFYDLLTALKQAAEENEAIDPDTRRRANSLKVGFGRLGDWQAARR